eukprot:2148686-Rhodomonas_salina.1
MSFDDTASGRRYENKSADVWLTRNSSRAKALGTQLVKAPVLLIPRTQQLSQQIHPRPSQLGQRQGSTVSHEEAGQPC